jgi:hypothetical protein
MQKFIHKHTNDAGFRDFIEATNKDEVLFDFGYELYLKFGENTLAEASHWVNPKILDIDNIINYYEKEGEFERCHALAAIKKRM